MTPESDAQEANSGAREAPPATADLGADLRGDLGDEPQDDPAPLEAPADQRDSTEDEAGDTASDHADGDADYYVVLGLSPSASAGDIHRAYRRLAKDWHPDRLLLAPPSERAAAERRIRALNQAYATLGDPFLRREYDANHYPERALAGAGAPSGWMGGMSPAYTRFGSMGTRAGVYGGNATRRPPAHPAATLDVGDFFGLLALILAVAIVAGSLHSSGEGLSLGPLLGMLVGAALFIVAMFSFAQGALLAQRIEDRMGSPLMDEDATWSGPSASFTGGAPPSVDEDPEEIAAAERFDALVDEALASIPEDFLDQMPNLLVEVEREPSRETLRTAQVRPGHTLLGLYVGVPTTAQGVSGAGPEHITIFRGPIERHCGGDSDRIRAQVRATVLHEIAHHFGIDHDEMPDWVK